tara:strand:- start:3049 stop:3339 length:291 start_codon:yes stop_codon:yes gene_type:complete
MSLIPNPFAAQFIPTGSSARDYQPVTPSDAENLSDDGGAEYTAFALYVGTAGDVRLVTDSGAERTIPMCDYGWILCGVRKVFSTGTTAAQIFALRA